MVRVIKRMSTAMLEGAPHLPKNSWALCDKYACFLHDFMPQATRNFHCPFYLRTGKVVNWKILSIHTMGAPLIYSPMSGPIHKRSAMNVEGHFMGIQWPAALVKRKSDNKILSCSRQKIRVYESGYLAELNQRVDGESVEAPPDLQEVVEEFVSVNDKVNTKTLPSKTGESSSAKPEVDKNMVQSIKGLREHNFVLPGQRPKEETALDKSADLVNNQFGGEGEYVDSICSFKELDVLTKLLDDAKASARAGVVKPSIRSQVLSKLKGVEDLLNNPFVKKGSLKEERQVKRDNRKCG
jgi:hypothetical protein